MAPPSRIAFERADPDDPTLSVDGLDDLLPKEGDPYDSTLAVGALQDFFLPKPVVPITRAVTEHRPIVSVAASEAAGRGNDVGRDADAPRLAARNDPTPVVNRPQKIFAPELAAPRLVARNDPTPIVNRPQEIFAPELAASIRRVVGEPRPIVSNAGRNTTGRDSYEGGGAGSPTMVTRVIGEAAIGHRVQEMWAPELSAPIRRIVDAPRLLVSEAEPGASGRESDAGGGAELPTWAASAMQADAIRDFWRVEGIVDAPRLLVSEAEPDASGRKSDVGHGVDLPTWAASAMQADAIRDFWRVESLVEAPRLLVSEVAPDASGRESEVDCGADLPAWAASAMLDDPIGDLGRVECEDPTLAVDALQEFFAPEPVAPITPVVEAPRLLVSEGGRDATGPESEVDCGADLPAWAASAMLDDPISDLGRVECEDPTLAVDADRRELPSEIQLAAMEFQRFAETFHIFASDCQHRRTGTLNGCTV